MFSDNISKNIAAAILAGGRNKRMGGQNKSFIKMQDIPIIQRTIDILKEFFEEIAIVTNSPSDYKPYGKSAHIITDIIKDIGPLGGIFSALSQTTKEAVFFVACDMPFLHNGMIRCQIACFNEVKLPRDKSRGFPNNEKGETSPKRINCEAVVPKIGDFIEPLHAIYKRSLKDNMHRFIKNSSDYSVKSFLRTGYNRIYYWQLEDNLFHKKIFGNLNTQQDLEKISGVL